MRKKIWVVIILLLIVVLLIPIPATYKDGGTKTYTSLTYKYIKWNKLMDIDEPDYTGTSLYLFPKNFMSIDELFKLEYDAIDKEHDMSSANPPSVIISPVDNELYLEYYGITVVLPEELAQDAEAELKFVDKKPVYYIFSPSVRLANVKALGPDWDGLANISYITALDEVVSEEEFNQNTNYQAGGKCNYIMGSNTYTLVMYHTSDLQCVCEGEPLDYYRSLEKLCDDIHLKR